MGGGRGGNVGNGSSRILLMLLGGGGGGGNVGNGSSRILLMLLQHHRNQ